ncbi:MAG: outer membrane protein assembly factor BamD [Nitrospirales bacterium]
MHAAEMVRRPVLQQNNLQHAKDLYQEITTKYPASSYAQDAQSRLTILNQVKPKQE